MAADLTKRREEAATCLQCHFRGYTVRSKLKQLQKNFEGIVHDLDGHDFHVVWLSNKERLSLPLMVTNEDRSKNKDVEDRTLTQDVCDKIDDISALNTRNHQVRLRDISDSPHHLFHDHIKRNLFDETISDKERNSTHSSKTAPIDNDMSHVQVGEVHDMSHPEAGENDNTSHPRSDKDIKVNHQEGHEIMINGSPCRVDEQMYTCHSTPVSSDDTECNDRAMRRHPLLTDSWMTDKSFDAVSDDSTISDKDLQQKREQIAMELLWNQQAIESRKNYLRLKKHMTSTDNES